MANVLFKNKRVNPAKLLPFGFVENGGAYVYFADIVDAQFRVIITITNAGEVDARVIDSASNDEYVLHHASGASGAFVNSVRKGYEGVLREIVEKCFETEIFKSDYARKIIQYARNTYNGEFVSVR